ncbi:MAG: divergent polysaccharide deacetylase family protein [Pseudomonadota bacterium]
MKRENEFNKPLRGVTSQKKARFPKAGLAVLVVVAACALPLFQFYGGFSLLAPERNPQQVAVVHPPQPPVSTETTATIPSRDHVLDPEKGDFQAVEPQGTLQPLTPSKPQPAILPKAPDIQRQELAMAHLPDPTLVERGAGGVIPRVSDEGLRALDVYSRRPDTEGNFGVARVVIVIGGLGISQTSTQQAIQSLPPTVTLAFAPYGNSLNRWMQQARKRGHELLLQVPMEPIDYPQNNPGPHTLRSEADLQENLANLHWAMSRITNYVGITNYLGNKMLQQPAGLSPVFGEISKRGLMFFDDGSVKNSMAEGVAVKELVPFAKGDIQIDNIRSRQAIAGKLQELAEQAKRTGLAVGVGNAFPSTIDLVSQFAQQARQNGIEITPVSAIVRDPKR